MTAITFETVVATDRQLRCQLPVSLPAGSKVRVTVETLKEELEASPPATELGRALWSIRQRALDRGMKLRSASDILEEMRQDRGELSGD
jgi:hypothetical protein